MAIVSEGVTNIPAHTTLIAVIPLSVWQYFTGFSVLSDAFMMMAILHACNRDGSISLCELFLSFRVKHLTWVLLIPPEDCQVTSQIMLWLWVRSEKMSQTITPGRLITPSLNGEPSLYPVKRKEKHLFFNPPSCLCSELVIDFIDELLY